MKVTLNKDKSLNSVMPDDYSIKEKTMTITDETFNDISITKIGWKWFYMNGEWVNKDARTTTEKIKELTEKLSNTDWVITKINEYKIYGEDLTEKYASVLEERKSLRKQINALENKL